VRPAASRGAVTALFFANGFGYGGWVAHLPAFKQRLNLSDGLLGLALLFIASAALVALPLTGAWIERHGSRGVAATSGLVASASLVLPFFATNYLAFVLAGVVLGAAYSAMDVSMNAQGVVVERATPAPIMSSFHATFSLGGLVGSLVSTLLLARFAAPRLDGVLVAVACCALVGATCRALAADPVHVAAGRSRRNAFSATAVLGAIAFFGLVGEGAMADWSGIYLRTIGTSLAASAGGFAAFSVAMAAGRACGDVVVARIGARSTVVGGALLAAASLSLALVFPLPWLCYVALAGVGVGLANVIPVLFSAAGGLRDVPSGVGIASVSTIGYAGFLLGPPTIGFTSDAVGLRFALALVVAGTVAIALLATRALPRRVPAVAPS
jgi:MFS family permease